MDGQRVATPDTVFQRRETPDYTMIWHLVGGANSQNQVCLIDADGNVRPVAVLDRDLRGDVAKLVEACEDAIEGTNESGYKRVRFPDGVDGLVRWHLGLDHAAPGEWPDAQAAFDAYQRLKQWIGGAS